MSDSQAFVTSSVSVIVPGRNEAQTITRVIERVFALPYVDEVIVVDNGSTDDTAIVAEKAGARVVYEKSPGMGHAVRTGILAARHDWILKVDADLDRFDVSLFANMIAARAAGIGLIKGNWTDPDDNKPMTRLLVQPAVARLAPGLKDFASVNSGLYAVDRRCFAVSELIGTYAVDIDVMLRVYAHGAGVCEVDIGTIEHDRRTVGHYSGMAQEISDFLFDRAAMSVGQELLVLTGNALVPDVLHPLLAERVRVDGRVTVASEQGGSRSLGDWPGLTILDNQATGFRVQSSSQELCIVLPAEADFVLIKRAHDLAAQTSVPCDILQLLRQDEKQSPSRWLGTVAMDHMIGFKRP